MATERIWINEKMANKKFGGKEFVYAKSLLKKSDVRVSKRAHRGIGSRVRVVKGKSTVDGRRRNVYRLYVR